MHPYILMPFFIMPYLLMPYILIIPSISPILYTSEAQVQHLASSPSQPPQHVNLSPSPSPPPPYAPPQQLHPASLAELSHCAPPPPQPQHPTTMLVVSLSQPMHPATTLLQSCQQSAPTPPSLARQLHPELERLFSAPPPPHFFGVVLGFLW